MGRELPGIVDQVITMALIQGKNDKRRMFVCQEPNAYDFPAKDRSGCLDMYEEPDLGALIQKIKGGTKDADA